MKSLDEELLLAHMELLSNPTIRSWSRCEHCASTDPGRVHYAHCPQIAGSAQENQR